MISSKLSLNGEWRLYFHVEDGNLPDTIEDVKGRGWSAISAFVPGNVELDIVRAAIEKDPFYADNLYSYRKYEFYQWWFEREFDVPQDFEGMHIELVLHGLDTYGTIWINGYLAGGTDNGLIEHIIDITNVIKAGRTNHIAVRIRPPLNILRDRDFPVNVKGNDSIDEIVWVRKPPHSYGWDISPRLPSAGIWRDIEITAGRNDSLIKEVYYVTRQAGDEKAVLLVKYRFSTVETYIDDFSVRVKGVCGSHIFSKECKAVFYSGEFTITIEEPRLWWPKGYGGQELYDVTFDLLHCGGVVDTRTERIGIRDLQVVTKYLHGDEGEFRIYANGCPILAKGSNWVPLDALHSRDKGKLKEALNLFEEQECNIIRCWGGNVYEDHEFFDRCDRSGLMVWQDFAMACGIYPQCDEFAQIIEKEASTVVKKLRNHPSILLWAGDNEIDDMYYWSGYHLAGSRYNSISREVLPRVVRSHDPFRLFVPSSPYVPENMTSIYEVPEQHVWGPRDYFKGDFYKHNTAHFISEVGYHGCPAVSSIKKFISGDKLWPYEANDEWDTHNTEYIKGERRGYNRIELMVNQIRIMFGTVPDNLAEFVLASQSSQAEADKYFVERIRINKWRNTGVILWNMLDCWPHFSDSMVDYYFKKKLSYHYVKRVQKQVCIMLGEFDNWQHRVVLGNDSRSDFTVRYVIKDGDTGDEILSGEKYSKGNENVDIGFIKAIPGSQRLYLITWEIDGIKYGNHYISGYVPFSLKKYADWLEKIRLLPQPFNSEECLM